MQVRKDLQRQLDQHCQEQQSTDQLASASADDARPTYTESEKQLSVEVCLAVYCMDRLYLSCAVYLAHSGPAFGDSTGRKDA